MATGWAHDGAVQEQIDATVKDAIERARAQLRSGPSLSHCEECDAAIPEARRKAVPGQGRAGRPFVHRLPASPRPRARPCQRLQPTRQQGQSTSLNQVALAGVGGRAGQQFSAWNHRALSSRQHDQPWSSYGVGG